MSHTVLRLLDTNFGSRATVFCGSYETKADALKARDQMIESLQHTAELMLCEVDKEGGRPIMSANDFLGALGITRVHFAIVETAVEKAPSILMPVAH